MVSLWIQNPLGVNNLSIIEKRKERESSYVINHGPWGESCSIYSIKNLDISSLFV